MCFYAGGESFGFQQRVVTSTNRNFESRQGPATRSHLAVFFIITAFVTGFCLSSCQRRISAWAIYDVFETGDDQQIFVGVVSDSQWVKFCQAFGLDDLGADKTCAANADRVQNRDILMPRIRSLFKQFDKQDLMEKLEYTGLPFAPIARPEDMFKDPHLCSSGGLLSLNLPEGGAAELPALPLEMAGRKFGVRHDLPGVGQHTMERLEQIGYGPETIRKMQTAAAVR